MGTLVYCVGVDAPRVAGALDASTRRTSCSMLPASVATVLRAVRQRAPDLVILGGDATFAGEMLEALSDEPAMDAASVIAWGVDGDGSATARLSALGARVAPLDDQALLDACEDLLDARDGRTVRVISAVDPDEALHGRRVLVAEDDPAVAWFFGDTLRRAGCDVHEVHDGWAALEHARRACPDVVLADIKMPALDGLRLCRALRVDPVLGDVPIVLLSWKGDWLTRARDSEVGATGYLGKHAVPGDVVRAVRRALEPHLEMEQRFMTPGPVRGLLGAVGVHRVLRLACASHQPVRVGLRSGPWTFEVQIRDGLPVAASRAAPGGDVVRGDEALQAMLTAKTGPFVVVPDRDAVEADLHGSLVQLAAPLVARVRGDGPRPTITPSVPIVVEPTQTLRVDPATATEPSIPMPLVRRRLVAAAADASRPSRWSTMWRAAMRAIAAT